MTVRVEINRQDLERGSASREGRRHSAEQGCLSGNSKGRTAKRLPDFKECENRKQSSGFIPETTSNSTAPIRKQRKKMDSARSFVPVAFVVIKPDCAKPDKNSIRQSCIGKLDKFSIPTAWHFLDSLPLTTAGKVDYQALEEMAEDKIEG